MDAIWCWRVAGQTSTFCIYLAKWLWRWEWLRGPAKYVGALVRGRRLYIVIRVPQDSYASLRPNARSWYKLCAVWCSRLKTTPIHSTTKCSLAFDKKNGHRKVLDINLDSMPYLLSIWPDPNQDHGDAIDFSTTLAHPDYHSRKSSAFRDWNGRLKSFPNQLCPV